MKFSKIIKFFFYIFSLIILIITISNIYIINFSKEYIYNDIEKIDDFKVALVLGTTKYTTKNTLNPYFTSRMNAAYELYRKGKVKHLILSGDNLSKNYNEPQKMKEYLLEMGVNEKDITLDYAGIRTHDSMIRAWKIFGQKKIIVVSQEFHNQRAIFIARNNYINVIGYNATSVEPTNYMRIREYLAKFKAIIDVYVLNYQPKYLGNKIIINL